jgi:hypothetical protein
MGHSVHVYILSTECFNQISFHKILINSSIFIATYLETKLGHKQSNVGIVP